MNKNHIFSAFQHISRSNYIYHVTYFKKWNANLNKEDSIGRKKQIQYKFKKFKNKFKNNLKKKLNLFKNTFCKINGTHLTMEMLLSDFLKIQSS